MPPSIHSRRMRRAKATTCAGVISIIGRLLTMADEKPDSPEIATLAADVTGVTVTCTATEIDSLKVQVN